MIFIPKLIFLYAGVAVLRNTNKPLYAALLVVTGNVIITLFFVNEISFSALVPNIIFATIFAFIYFYLLKLFDHGILWWIILIGGLIFGFI